MDNLNVFRPIEQQYAIRGFRGSYEPFAMHYPVAFTMHSRIEFTSVYQALQWHRVKSMGWREDIMTARSIGEIKEVASKAPSRDHWDNIKIQVMLSITDAKFNQNMDLADLLVNTGFKYLEETNNSGDDFWGVHTPGKGQNYLGRCLMIVRSRLIEKNIQHDKQKIFAKYGLEL